MATMLLEDTLERVLAGVMPPGRPGGDEAESDTPEDEEEEEEASPT